MDEYAFPCDILSEIKVEGRIKTWSEIDHYKVKDAIYILLENDTYGDECACLVIKLPPTFTRVNGRILIPKEYEICETYDNIKIALCDEGIIDEY